MAQIFFEKIQKIEKSRNTIHEKAHATYSVFELEGKKYVQIDTYGGSNREHPEKISQSFQLDREAAKYLVALLCKEFF